MLDRADVLLALGGHAAAPAEPDPMVTLEEGAQRDFEPARPRAAIAAWDRDAVGHHDDARPTPFSPNAMVRQTKRINVHT